MTLPEFHNCDTRVIKLSSVESISTPCLAVLTQCRSVTDG